MGGVLESWRAAIVWKGEKGQHNCLAVRKKVLILLLGHSLLPAAVTNAKGAGSGKILLYITTMKAKTILALGIGMAVSSVVSAQADAFESASSVTLLDSTYVTVQPSGSSTFNITRVLSINDNDAALKNHCIVYDYDPMTASARFKYVRVARGNGEKTDVDVSAAKDYAAPARSIFWGARQIMIEVGHLAPGDTLAYEIEKRGFTYALLAGEDGTVGAPGMAGTGGNGTGAADDERFVPPLRGQFYDIVPFWVDQPTRRKVYSLSLPDTCRLQYKLYQYDGKYTERKSSGNGRQYITIALDNQVPFGKEPSMLDLYDVAPKLMLSTTKDWFVKSRWFYKVQEDYGSFKPTREARAKVAQLLKGKKTEMEKISTLTHWVADNIRYLGMPMGKGEGYTLHSLDMDMTDRAGVCKDIAGTLIGMLRIAGFKAYPAMTMAGSRVERIPADHFNHCVCVVRLKNGKLMPLDPTWVPFNRELWSSAEQQQNYLPGIPQGSDLLETPVSAPENHYIRIKADNTLALDGTLKGTYTIEAEGQSDASVRSVFTRGWMSRWSQTLEAELLKVSPKAKVLSVDYGKEPKNYQKSPIHIIYKYEIPDYATGDSTAMAFKPLVMNNLYRSLQSFLTVGSYQGQRNYGFKDRCSRQVDFVETITLPSGMTMQKSPMKSDVSNSAASIKASLSQAGNKVRLSVDAKFNKRVYDASDWAGFKEVVDTYKKYQDYIYIK
jgi:hypothetical protein